MSCRETYWQALQLAAQAEELSKQDFPAWLENARELIPQLSREHTAIEKRIMLTALLHLAVTADFHEASNVLECFSEDSGFSIGQLVFPPIESMSLRNALLHRAAKHPERFSQAAQQQLTDLLRRMVGRDYLLAAEIDLAKALFVLQPELPDATMAKLLEVLCLQMRYSYEVNAFDGYQEQFSRLLQSGGRRTKQSLAAALLESQDLTHVPHPPSRLIRLARQVLACKP